MKNRPRSRDPHESADRQHDASVMYTTCLQRRGVRVGEMQQPAGSSPEFSELPQLAPSSNASKDFVRLVFGGASDKFMLATGNQLKSTWEQVCSESGISCLSERQNDSRWSRHWSAIRCLFEQFFSQAGDNPSQVWSYTACYSDQSLFERYGFDCLSQSKPNVAVTYQPTEPAVLQVQSPLKWPGLVVDTSQLHWLLPDGYTDRDVIVERRDTDISFRNKYERHREVSQRLAPAPRGLHERRSTSPELFSSERITHCVWDEPSTGKATIANEPPSETHVPGVVITDCWLLKLWRLYTGNYNRIRAQSLLLALERNQGSLIYIGQSDGPYRHLTCAVSEWLRKHK